MHNIPTVFLIDDDTDDQEIFSLAMEKANQQVQCVFADDGIHALEKLKTDTAFRPDFIFIDMNMPRMNGQQCLTEIKKIDRLRDVPVYMYSTSADPESLEENKRLGASDFIVKPSSITELTDILSQILHKHLVAVLMVLFLISAQPLQLLSQNDIAPVRELKKLTVEELMNIVVTSVSKTPENLSEVASAIQVVTGNDLRRSTSVRLAEALRLAPNLQVTQSGSHDWGISARGFNGAPVASSSLADKLLVMIDGRTVYTPLFGGVYWDVQNVLIEDIDRLEVVSGPGGTLWGSNAVNGVVNVITKSADETQGLYLSGAFGSLVKGHIAARYGSQVDSSLFFRIYGQRFDFDNTLLANGDDAHDDWHLTQGGFRMDYYPSDKNTITIQGELYGGVEDDTLSTTVNGQHVLARWTHAYSETSGLVVQSYLERTWREISNNPFTDELTTIDLDLQYSFPLGESNQLLAGIGMRTQDDQTTSFDNRFDPQNRTLNLVSGFIQDQITLVPNRFNLTIGSKFLYNNYTELEVQPSARLAWTPNETHTLWAAVSNAVRTPSRFDVDLSTFYALAPEFRSEEVIAYEAGYRIRPFNLVSFSLAAFYNQYDDLRSLNTSNDTLAPFYFGNDLKGNTYGFEISGTLVPGDWWRLRGGYTFLEKEFEIKAANVFPGTELLEGIDPRHQFLVQSIMDISKRFQIDVVGRIIGKLPAAAITQTPEIPSYVTFNARLAYVFNKVTFILAGQNLAQPDHIEFGTRRIPRSIYGKIEVRL